ncbi:MAG: hypothetical protein VYA67_21960 [Actinomycetota bacterium]|nr:hypothetical protein [Actinomycetota bacterium]
MAIDDDDTLRQNWADGQTVHGADLNEFSEEILETATEVESLTDDVAEDGAAIDSLNASVNSLIAARQPAGQLCTLSRSMANYVAPAVGEINLTYFRAPAALSFSNIGVVCGDVVVTALTLAKFGVWSVAGNGNLTRIGVTANATGILGDEFANYQVPLLAAASLTPNQWYAYGFIVDADDPMVKLAGSFVLDDANLEPRLCGLLTGQTDLPASIAAGDIGHNYRTFYARLF